MKVLFIPLLLLLLVASCHSVPERVTPALNDARTTIDDSTLSPVEKRVVYNAFTQCEAQAKYVIDLETELSDLTETNTKLRERLADVSRDAGYKDAFQAVLWGLFGLLGFGVLFALIYLVAKGKLKIPFLLG